MSVCDRGDDKALEIWRRGCQGAEMPGCWEEPLSCMLKSLKLTTAGSGKQCGELGLYR